MGLQTSPTSSCGAAALLLISFHHFESKFLGGREREGRRWLRRHGGNPSAGPGAGPRGAPRRGGHPKVRTHHLRRASFEESFCLVHSAPRASSSEFLPPCFRSAGSSSSRCYGEKVMRSRWMMRTRYSDCAPGGRCVRTAFVREQ